MEQTEQKITKKFQTLGLIPHLMGFYSCLLSGDDGGNNLQMENKWGDVVNVGVSYGNHFGYSQIFSTNSGP